MTKTLKISDLILCLPLLLVLSIIALVYLPLFQPMPATLAYGITLDLVLTIPFIYFLIIRKREIPKITVSSVFIVCLMIAHYIIPPTHQTFLNRIEFWLFPIVEFSVISYIIVSARKTIRQFKVEKKESPDFYTALCTACKAALPKRVAMVLAMEIAVVHYALFAWKTTEKLKPNEFTSHKKSGISLVVYAFIMIVLAETFAVHVAVGRWNETVAWILTGLSLYTCLQLFALVRSLPKRLTYIDVEAGKIQLRYGFFNETTIDINDITAIKLTTRSLPKDGSVVKFSALGNLDTHNIILYLKEETILQRVYGIKKPFKALAIYMDEKEAFVSQLNELRG